MTAPSVANCVWIGTEYSVYVELSCSDLGVYLVVFGDDAGQVKRGWASGRALRRNSGNAGKIPHYTPIEADRSVCYDRER